jgi:hypothetical protein
MLGISEMLFGGIQSEADIHTAFEILKCHHMKKSLQNYQEHSFNNIPFQHPVALIHYITHLFLSLMQLYLQLPLN